MRSPEEIEACLLRGRAAAEALMTTRVRVHRATGRKTTDPRTGVVTAETSVVYGDGPDGDVGKVQTGAGGPRGREDVAGRFAVVEGPRVDLPVRSRCAPGDIVEVLASRMDPDLVGLRLELRELDRGEYRTADRWSAELVTR